MSRIFDLKARPAGLVIGGLIALKIGVLFALAWRRRIIMDEFAQLGWAKYLGHGLFDTVWPSKSVGFTVFIKLAHLLGWDAQSILLIGRIQTGVLACATLAIIYGCARTLGESRLRSAVIILVLLSFSNFIERIFEMRAEPLAVFFAAAALLVAIRSETHNWRVLGAGMLCGLSFLSTQKAVYFDVALGLALVGDGTLGRRYGEAMARGSWLVGGWFIPVVVYCFVFGGSDPLPVASNLVFGPAGVASPQIAAEYGGLRHFVVQTIERNAILYAFSFCGMILALVRIRRLDGNRRIALIFTLIVTALVFTHNQPWPYVFVMALPFMALWSLEPLDALSTNKRYLSAAWSVLGFAIAASFVRNIQALRIDNRDQLALISIAEKLVGPSDAYFDGVGMLPNRAEPSTLWLDRHTILKMLREGKASEAYRIFAVSPPKLILWSYRMDAIEPLVDPLIRQSYVSIAGNLRISGRRLHAGDPTSFNVPVAGRYALYDLNGYPITAELDVDGRLVRLPEDLGRGPRTVTLQRASGDALLIPEGSYGGRITIHGDNPSLFADVYD